MSEFSYFPFPILCQTANFTEISFAFTIDALNCNSQLETFLSSLNTQIKIYIILLQTYFNSMTAQLFFDDLINHQKSTGFRYQAIFELKNLASNQAIQLLMKAYDHCGQSILLKHELLYALGQLSIDKYDLVRDFLIKKVENQSENSLSRHEAAEALANYFKPEIIQLYRKYLDSTCKQLRWTCQIAVEKVKHAEMKELYGNKYSSTMEPAAPFTQPQFQNYLKSQGLQDYFAEHRFLALLLKDDIPLFDKYRIMYYMRDLNTEEVRRILCELLSLKYFKTQTSLLKHEICFIIGQIGCENYEHLIRECIENEEEEDIVRHEALAAVASQSKDAQYLQKFLNSDSQLIKESAEVAINTIKYWNQ